MGSAEQTRQRLHRENTERLTALETGLESTNRIVRELAEGVRRQGEETRQSIEALSGYTRTSLDSLAREFHTSRRPDFAIWIGAGGLALAFIVAIGSAAMAPLYLSSNTAYSRLDKVESWQLDYMMGRIPSSAENKLLVLDSKIDGKVAAIKTEMEGKSAELSKTFAEVEQQFRDYKGQIERDRDYTRERADNNHKDIEVMDARQRESSDQRARLDERVKALERERRP